MTEIDGPSWDVIAKDIRMGIASGEYPEGKRIPSTQKLMERYGVSKGPVRQAVEALRAAGLLAGRPGVGVYVTGVPEAEPDGLEVAVRKLQEDVAALKADKADKADVAKLKVGVAELQARRPAIDGAARRQVRTDEQSG